MYASFIVDVNSLIALLLFADGNDSLCSDDQKEVFIQCQYFSYKIIIPCSCIFELLDKIRLGRMQNVHNRLDSDSIVHLIEVLLEQYNCELGILDIKSLHYIFEKQFINESLSLTIINKMAEFHNAVLC